MEDFLKGLVSLVLLVVVLLVMFIFLIGDGFVESSDSGSSESSSTSDVIVVDDLDVKLLAANGVGEYSEAQTEKNLYEGLWEPNATKIAYFKIQNDSTFRIQVELNLYAELNGMGGALEYVALDCAYQDMQATSWQELSNGHTVYELNAGNNSISEDFLYIDAGNCRYVAIAVHMKKTSGNEYQDQTCELDVKLLAGKAE